MEGIGQGLKRRRLNARAWRELLKRFDTAGVTVDEFCQGERLSRSTFNRWRARLQVQSGDSLALARRRASGEKTRAPALAPSPTPFVDLGLLGAANAGAPAPALELRLELGGGVVLHLVRR